ncbi:glycosyltransferase [Persicitalea jodogahamensis]|uniref:Glycosyltransferase n=1 Tax=Persicitalea jodogahamensis TaxID=402147 RepID=A0A8J3D8K7_9BACT|nr:glycosyltransferase [Persicitalea jodogahamensis]GHB61437.1 hypothetical protein GCM10007390_14090 [Persicitalea jodogahamensis]
MDLKGKNIVFFSLFRFDADIESTAFFLARQLALENNVYYFDNAYTFNDWVKKRKTPAFRTRQGKFGLFSDEPIAYPGSSIEIHILPVLLSIRFLPEGKIYRTLLKFNEYLIRTKIRHILKKRGVHDFVFINSFNFHFPGVAGPLHPQLTVYHCLDPIVGDFDRRHGLISERHLSENADLIICSSRQLFQEKRTVNPETYFVPNAADLEHSRRALDPGLLPSPLLANVPHPIVGYLGSIEHRMDFSLLTHLVQQHADKSFVLVGPIYAAIPEVLKRAPNVYFPGKVRFSDAPSVMKGYDLCIIPFKKDEHSASIFPLKLFEYLGAGKPVVISDFNPDLADFTLGSVAMCATPAAFVEAIQEALDNDSDERRAERISVASKNTWKQRAKDFSGLIATALAQQTVGKP